MAIRTSGRFIDVMGWRGLVRCGMLVGLRRWRVRIEGADGVGQTLGVAVDGLMSREGRRVAFVCSRLQLFAVLVAYYATPRPVARASLLWRRASIPSSANSLQLVRHRPSRRRPRRHSNMCRRKARQRLLARVKGPPLLVAPAPGSQVSCG